MIPSSHVRIAQKAFEIMPLPKPHTQGSDFIDQRWDLCTKLSKTTTGNWNVWPGLRTTGLEPSGTMAILSLHPQPLGMCSSMNPVG